jgi:negative regulator of sigma E activity
MENRDFRHVSTGALLLVACALLAAVAGAVSVVASELEYRAVRTGATQIIRIQGKAADQHTISGLSRPFGMQSADISDTVVS